jgi:Dullard-like phosphatase family protein
MSEDEEPTVKHSKKKQAEVSQKENKANKVFSKMKQSTGTIQELNESKEVSHGNNSLFNSKEKFPMQENN